MGGKRQNVMAITVGRGRRHSYSGLALRPQSGGLCRAAKILARLLIGHAGADYPLQDEGINERSGQRKDCGI